MCRQYSYEHDKIFNWALIYLIYNDNDSEVKSFKNKLTWESNMKDILKKENEMKKFMLLEGVTP